MITTYMAYVELTSNRLGKKAGEVRMIKNGDLVEAHQVSTTWIGEIFV